MDYLNGKEADGEYAHGSLVYAIGQDILTLLTDLVVGIKYRAT